MEIGDRSHAAGQGGIELPDHQLPVRRDPSDRRGRHRRLTREPEPAADLAVPVIAVLIPFAHILVLPECIERVQHKEAPMLRAARSGAFTLELLEQAMSESDDIH